MTTPLHDLWGTVQRQRTRIKRLGWGFFDQALFTATNFVTTALVARYVSVRQFGAFALVMSISLVFRGGTQALVSEPLSVRQSGLPDAETKPVIEGAGGLTLLIGLVAGAGMVVAGLAGGPTMRPAFVAMGLVLWAVLLQNVFRYALMARGHARGAVLNDVCWAVAQAIGVAVVLGVLEPTTFSLMMTWGVGAIAGTLVGLRQLDCRPRLTKAAAWLRAHHDLGGPYLIEFFAVRGTTQTTMWILGAVAGLAELGNFHGAVTLLGPVTVMVGGLHLVLLPESVRLRRRSRRRMHQLVVLASVAAGMLVAGWVAVVLVVPDAWGRELLGATWAGAIVLVPLLALNRGGAALSLGPLLGLRALQDPGRSMKAQLIIGGMSFGAGSFGAVIDGARGVAVGIGVAKVVGMFIWWHLYGAGRREMSRVEEMRA